MVSGKLIRDIISSCWSTIEAARNEQQWMEFPVDVGVLTNVSFLYRLAIKPTIGLALLNIYFSTANEYFVVGENTNDGV